VPVVDTAHGVELPETLAEIVARPRFALLVYDMQVGILGQIAEAERVIANVRRAIDAARAAGAPVLYVRHVTLPVELMGISQLRVAKAWQRRDRAADATSIFPPAAPHSQISPDVAPTDAEAVFDKITMSAFAGTPLDIVLRDRGVMAVGLVGAALEVGIEPTARHAADLGYIPVLVEDACGWGDETAARRSLDALRFAGDTVIASTDELSGALSGS
jgi:nicotinamidase-related amidase